MTTTDWSCPAGGMKVQIFIRLADHIFLFPIRSRSRSRSLESLSSSSPVCVRLESAIWGGCCVGDFFLRSQPCRRRRPGPARQIWDLWRDNESLTGYPDVPPFPRILLVILSSWYWLCYCLMAPPRLRHLVARIAKLGSHKVVSVTALVTISKHYYWIISL